MKKTSHSHTYQKRKKKKMKKRSMKRREGKEGRQAKKCHDMKEKCLCQNNNQQAWHHGITVKRKEISIEACSRRRKHHLNGKKKKKEATQYVKKTNIAMKKKLCLLHGYEEET